MPPATSVGGLCEIHAVLCSKIADVHEVELHDFRTWKFVYFGKHYRLLLHNTRDVTRGVKMAQSPGRRITAGPKSHNIVMSTYFKIVHLLLKDLRFEHGGAKLVSFPRRHLTSVLPCISRLSSQNGEICYKNTCPSVASYQSQTI